MVRDTTISSLNVDEDFSFSTKSSLSFAHLSNGFERKQKRHPQISLESVVGVWHLRKKKTPKKYSHLAAQWPLDIWDTVYSKTTVVAALQQGRHDNTPLYKVL